MAMITHTAPRHGVGRAIAGVFNGASMIIWLSAGAVLAFVLWASFAWIDEIVRADGEVTASSKPQIIQNLEGGIMSELMVSEGDVVMRGQTLARLHSTKFQSSVTDLQDQIIALEIRRIRLEVEMAGLFEFSVPELIIQNSPEIFRSENALLRARQMDYVNRREGANRVMDEAMREKKLYEDMLKKGVVAEVEVTRVRKAATDAQVAYDETISKTELDRAQAYSDVLKELQTLKQTLNASQDQLTRTVLTSPMDGVVTNLAITTIGGVIRPGEEIMRIIPVDDEMFIEARVKPEDIAGVEIGQSATVKLSAYDYTIFGTLHGTVDVISADTFKDERAQDGDPHYKVTVKVAQSLLSDRQKHLEIRPGMQAQVELHTGERTVMQYLVKPLYKSTEAFGER